MGQLGNEQKLLLLCARGRLGSEGNGAIRQLLSPPLDWEKIKELAKRQGMVPLLHHNLAKFKAKVPQGIMREFQKEHKKSLQHNLLVFARARELLLALQKNKIPAIVPKGISTSQKYSADNLKCVGDIDLLVKMQDISVLEQILAKQGWITTSNYAEIKAQRLKDDCQLPQFAIAGATLDTHWNLSRHVQIQEAELWKDAVNFNFEGAHALELAPEKQLCYLCLHSILVHGAQTLVKDLVDINETIEHYNAGKKQEIDWNKLCKVAERWKVSACVYFCLFNVQKHLGNKQIPGKALANLHEKSNKAQLAVLGLLGDRLLTPLPRNQMRVLRLFLRKMQ